MVKRPPKNLYEGLHGVEDDENNQPVNHKSEDAAKIASIRKYAASMPQVFASMPQVSASMPQVSAFVPVCERCEQTQGLLEDFRTALRLFIAELKSRSTHPPAHVVRMTLAESPVPGRAGGLARKSKLTSEQRKEIAQRAIRVRWSKGKAHD